MLLGNRSKSPPSPSGCDSCKFGNDFKTVLVALQSSTLSQPGSISSQYTLFNSLFVRNPRKTYLTPDNHLTLYVYMLTLCYL